MSSTRKICAIHAHDLPCRLCAQGKAATVGTPFSQADYEKLLAKRMPTNAYRPYPEGALAHYLAQHHPEEPSPAPSWWSRIMEWLG